MLCSPCCSRTVVDKTLDLLHTSTSIQGDTSTSIQGWDAVWMLCKIRTEVTETFKVVVERYPAIVLSYGTSVLGTDSSLVSGLCVWRFQWTKLCSGESTFYSFIGCCLKSYQIWQSSLEEILNLYVYNKRWL